MQIILFRATEIYLKMKLNKKIIILIVILIVFFIILAIPIPMKKTTTLKYKDFVFETEIRDTNSGRKTGLTNYESLDKSQAMLFEFKEENEYGFWMKNMKFPIDMIWLDEDFKITDIKNNIQPCESEPCPIYIGIGKYVLEIYADLSNELNMIVGDSIDKQ